MQSTSKVNIVNDDKSLAEWPTLSEVVCNSVKQNSHGSSSAKSGRHDLKMTSSPSEKGEGYESSKENEDSGQNSNGRGARKKGSRMKWMPVPIAPPPYRKRGNGRSYDSNRGGSSANSDRKNESHENMNGVDNSKSRGCSRFKSKRGRGFAQNWRSRKEETSRGEVETNDNTDRPLDADYYPTVMYYDPFLTNCYTAVLREGELKKAIRNQIEYYFCEENLVADIYMRRQMDARGYVPLALVAGFRRVRNLTENFATIVEAVDESDKLELIDTVEGMKIRPVVDPLRWPLPNHANQIFGLRTDVPEFIPGKPYTSTIVESMQKMTLCTDAAPLMNSVYSDQCFPNGVASSSDHFDSLMQSTVLEANG